MFLTMLTVAVYESCGKNTSIFGQNMKFVDLLGGFLKITPDWNTATGCPLERRLRRAMRRMCYRESRGKSSVCPPGNFFYCKINDFFVFFSFINNSVAF